MTFTFQTFSPWQRGTFTFIDIYIYGRRAWSHTISGAIALSTKLCVYAWLQLQCTRAHTVLNHTKHAFLCTRLNPRPKPKSAPLFKGTLVLLFRPAMFPNVHLLHPAVRKTEKSSYIVLENKWPLFWTCLIFMEAPFTPPNALGSPKRWIEYLNHGFYHYTTH